MLTCEDVCRCKESGLLTKDAMQIVAGDDADDCFAATDISLQEAEHRCRTVEFIDNCFEDVFLAIRECKGERRQKLFDDIPAWVACFVMSARFVCGFVASDVELDTQQLFKKPTLVCLLDVCLCLWIVDLMDHACRVDQSLVIEELLRELRPKHRIQIDAYSAWRFVRVEERSHFFGKPGRLDSLYLRVDRIDPPDCAAGLGCRLMEWMPDRRFASLAFGFASEDICLSLLELPKQICWRPPHDKLCYHLATMLIFGIKDRNFFAGACLGDRTAGDRRLDRLRRIIKLYEMHRDDLRSILIGSGKVAQKILDRKNPGVIEAVDIAWGGFE